MNFQQDDTWTVFNGVTDNLENFRNKFVPDIYLKPSVHKDIKESFRVIKKLIEFSFYEYKFYDVATLKSMITMEMALKLRYEELEKIKWNKNDSLRKLIKWFEERNYFEVYNPDYLKSLRYIRNQLAHPYQHNFSGPHTRHIIENVLDLINGLYEDTELRKYRMATTLQLINVLDGFKKGMKVMGKNFTHLAFEAWPGFVNNKSGTSEIHFYYKPCYKVPDTYFENNTWTISPTQYFQANAFDLFPDRILFKNNNGDQISISEITDMEEQKYFSDWLKKYEDYSQPTGDFIYTSKGITDTFLLHLREFHKI
jgi:hypothetical protein